MKRTRWLGLSVMALALAGIAGLVTLRQFQRGRVQVLTTPVVVATLALSPGVPLEPSELTTVNLPPATLPAHVFHRPQQLAGRVLTTAAVPRQVIVAEMVAKPGTGVGLPPLIPAGMRAVSVKVNDVVSVAGYVLPGTHVDVLLTGNHSATGNPRGVTTVTLLSNVQVLTAGEQMEQVTTGKPKLVTVITLLVTPIGAEKLALSERFGHIQLALRNPLDEQRPEVAPVLNATLFHEFPLRPAPVGVALRRRRKDPPAHVDPPPPQTVELLLGTARQTLSFPYHR
ncbi:MAG: Flp pilus assembly protein CpaB [Terriglobales bacterium]